MKSTDPMKNEKRSRILWILPLLILPFATLLFWAMGGGGNAAASPGKVANGFNAKLPSPKASNDEALDKLSYYDQAALDSSKVDELRKKDPNYRYDSTAVSTDSAPVGRKGLAMGRFQSPQEQRVYEKLEALQRTIRSVPASPPQAAPERTAITAAPAGDAKELQQLLQSMNTAPEADPELAQIGGMLENILDLQYPERMAQKIKEESNKNRGKVYGIAASRQNDMISSLSPGEHNRGGVFAEGPRHNGFFSLDGQEGSKLQDNAIQARIAETQSVVNGSTVKMVLDQEIYINGKAIPKGTFLVGTASLKGERLAIGIENIRYGNSIYPVELTVYDLDGLDGIYIPGAISREVAKASADRSMQALGVTSLSDSWEAQAAGAGVEAAKGLFSRKVKLVKVTLKKGYTILLKDEKQKD